MTITTVDCDEQSTFYVVTDTGALNFYRDEARNGNGVWAFGGQPKQIGQGWQSASHIVCGDGGVIYAVETYPDNAQVRKLVFYRDLARDGNGVWAFGGAGQVVDPAGWENYVRVVNGGNGILYAIDFLGDMWFFLDQNRDGSPFNGPASRVGTGWNECKDVAYGGNGILYGLTLDGRLLFYQDLARDGRINWANGGQAQQIGQGWDSVTRLLSGQDGILYGITGDGRVLFFRDLARNGNGVWANGGAPQQIGQGWIIG